MIPQLGCQYAWAIKSPYYSGQQTLLPCWFRGHWSRWSLRRAQSAGTQRDRPGTVPCVDSSAPLGKPQQPLNRFHPAPHGLSKHSFSRGGQICWCEKFASLHMISRFEILNNTQMMHEQRSLGDKQACHKRDIFPS